MNISPEVHAACIKVAGDWAIKIALSELAQSSQKKVKGKAILQKNFQQSYQFLIEVVDK